MSTTQEKARIVVKNIHTAYTRAKEETVKIHKEVMPNNKKPRAPKNLKFGTMKQNKVRIL
jgi:hypothetical protein